MFRPRIIPVLLLKEGALVKSKKFRQCSYIGDPLNAVRIFNELRADELVFLDICASKQNRTIDLQLVKQIASEAGMPFAVGGGIASLENIRAVLRAGADRVVINTAAILDPTFIRRAADEFGSSTITVCLDVKKQFLRGPKVWGLGGTRVGPLHPAPFARWMEQLGAGELILQSIDRDGEMQGYDLALIKEVTEAVTIPVVALGGAGHLSHLRAAYQESYASGLGAGSLFVFHGPHRGVLINYPDRLEILDWFRPV